MQTRIPTIWITAMALLAFAAISSRADEAKTTKAAPIADADTTKAVERELRQDPALPFDSIDVTVKHGVATLRGSAGSMLAKRRAARQAATVRGVRSVVNLLVIPPVRGLTDDQIAARVRQALLTDPATDAYEVSVEVTDGKVVLNGSTESWRERALCETVAMGVRGVREIQNRITVARSDDRPDGEIKAEIEQALRWDVYIDHGLITVAVQDGVVTLSGTVGSAAEKNLAVAKAFTRGVDRVDAERLDVARWAREPDLRSDKWADVSDEAVQKAVERAMLHDPRVYSFQVDAEVDDGLVTLKGTVDNVRAKRSAAQDARNTVGAVAVLNHLKVKPAEPRSDEAIRKEILEGLARAPHTWPGQIVVTVRDGVARLRGTADSYVERGIADDIASRVSGVRDIVNRIQVLDRPVIYDPYVDLWYLDDTGPMPHPVWESMLTDLALARRVEQELAWSPFVDATNINVSVQGGVATLTGEVGSWTEWSFARQNAYEAGATFVRNKLEIGYDGAVGQ